MSVTCRCIIGVWCFFSLILSAEYGGNLRATLLRPSNIPPIETVKDIVESGLPWKMVLFGEDIDNTFAAQTEENYVKFWAGKETIEYDPFPYQDVISSTNST